MTQRLRKIFITPFEKFLKVESLSGLLLFGATIISLLWANSTWGDTYKELWEIPLGFQFHNFELTKPLILWINDGLMAIFFFLIGLEIKREVLLGELNTLKKASLPIFAALGGIIIPVLLFLVLNPSGETSKGWGIPMATDIAFTLAILNLLGNRVPLSLKIFLTAFAIVDDIGAVLTIAVFYSTNIAWDLIGYSFLLLAFLFILTKRGYYNRFLYLGIGSIIWLLFLKSGIHPTIAGILIAFTIPVKQRGTVLDNSEELKDIVDQLSETKPTSKPILVDEQISLIEDLEDWTKKVQSPLQNLEHKLHSWIAYFIIPVFALSNAGVAISADNELHTGLSLSIIIALIFGKSIGVVILSWIGVKTGLASLPAGVNFNQIIGIGFLAGVGFTMSFLLQNLAFEGNTISY